MSLHFQQCALKSVTQVTLFHTSLVGHDAKDVLIQKRHFGVGPFKYSKRRRPRHKQVAGMHMKFFRDLALRPIERLSCVREILDSDNPFPFITPVLWFERSTVDELGD